jgi:GTP-binding protein
LSEGFPPGRIEAGRRLFAGPKHFVLGVASLDGLPSATLPEIAFAGRSNVGKSSLINALTGTHGLARASNTPGRTRELNFFNIADVLHLVDMPGYGYAEAPKADVRKWQSLLRAYLRGRPGLLRCFLLIDARHGVKPSDGPIMKLLDEAAVSFQFVLTKSDKIGAAGLSAASAALAGLAAKRPAALPFVHATSSETGLGLPELRAEIAALVGYRI